MFGPITPRLAAAELIVAGAMWGFGFIATVWTLAGIEPTGAVVIRYVLVALIGVPLMALPFYRGMRGWDQARAAFWPGIFMCLTMVLQTWGLKYTTATKSSFITVTYVLMVPLIEKVFFRKGIPAMIFLFAATGLFGTAMICEFDPFSPMEGRWNVGDLMTLGCALAGAGQIIALGRVATRIKSSYILNMYQCLWALPVSMLFLNGPINLSAVASGKPLLGLLYIAIGSTLVAFMLQVRAQRVLSPSLASLLFLLESPFAAIFAAIFLGERLNASQWAGAAVILASSLGAIRFSRI